MTLELFFLAIVVSYDQDITGLVPSIIFLYNNNNNNNNNHVSVSLVVWPFGLFYIAVLACLVAFHLVQWVFYDSLHRLRDCID